MRTCAINKSKLFELVIIEKTDFYHYDSVHFAKMIVGVDDLYVT